MVGGLMLCDPECDDLTGYIVHWYGGDGDALNWEDFAHTGLQDVSMLNLSLGWAVGTQVDPGTKDWVSAILQWDGTAWKTVEHNAKTGGLEGIDALNANNVWAVGSLGKILHWNGSQWIAVDGPADVKNTLLDVDVYSETEAWAAGTKGTLLHWNGQSWILSNNPITSTLNAISVVSPSDVWAVGENGVILHYGPVPSPTLSLNYSTGSPGSYFSVTGQKFPANTPIDFKVNQYSLGTVTAGLHGNLSFILDTSQADPGAYTLVTVGIPSNSVRFMLDPAVVYRVKEGNGIVFSVPAGIAASGWIYLPVIVTGYTPKSAD